MTTPSPSTERALVLGGGGSAGNAWLIGVIAGLLDGGLDVRVADLIVGTSAGATAAAQITGAEPNDLLAEILSAPTQSIRPPRPATDAGNPQSEHLARFARIIEASDSPAEMRVRMGALAREAGRDTTAQWRQTVAARLPRQDWPPRAIALTAVDAETGVGLTFDRDSGVDLVDAVAASTSGGRAYRIGARQFIDGGYRRNENADLARGYERVLVLAPLGGATLHPLDWRMQLSAQIDELRDDGSEVEVIVPDVEARTAFGDNLLDPTTRPPAARAGFRQGVDAARVLGAFWR